MRILNDFNTSVEKALNDIDKNWRAYNGLVVCGTHSPHDVEEIIDEIKKARENGTTFLGICFGHQLAAIEYARNVLGISDATSEEFGEGTFVVKKLPELKVGRYYVDGEFESFWNNYEVVEGFDLMWKKSDNFVTCQYHPEYMSSKNHPHPLLVKFLSLCK